MTRTPPTPPLSRSLLLPFPMAPATILLVEDDVSLAAELRHVLESEGWRVLTAGSAEQGFATAQRERCDVAVTDFRLPGRSGLELVRQLHAAQPRLPVIVMTAHGTTETAIEATKLGAYDYLLKPFDMPDLIGLIENAIASSRMMCQPVALGEAAAGSDTLVGRSRAMQEIYKEIGRVAEKNVTVLIRGETGTGKELVARAIYQHSARADQPFIAVNCSAIPDTLLESELFGHEKGAFTGADARRIGRFEQAGGGTLFLDEIGDMSMDTQVKLLRVLQEKCFQRVGGKETIHVDTRVIAATHRDLERAIAERAFREDLFYRLNVVTVAVPPLRQRAEDVPELVRYFLGRHGADLGVERPAIQSEALDLLGRQPWPGNVRELENTVRKALLLARGYPIGAEEVRRALAGARTAAPAESAALSRYVGELLDQAERGELQHVREVLIAAVERELFAQAIKLARGNQTRAARWLGVSRLTMREKLAHFGLHAGEGPV
jgi:nitrogen regulation protein NR(I)